MARSVNVLLLLGAALLSSCASQGYVSSWKAPDAAPLELRGAKVAAVVMMKDQASRRSAEDTLAREITARGAQGVAMYTLMPDESPTSEAASRAALEKAAVLGVVVMRPVKYDTKLDVTPIVATGPAYRGYYGGYYGHGWGSPYSMPMTVGNEVSSRTVVSIETLVYSLKQNKLIWTGTSEVTDPKGVPALVTKLAAKAAAELEKQGLIQK